MKCPKLHVESIVRIVYSKHTFERILLVKFHSDLKHHTSHTHQLFLFSYHTALPSVPSDLLHQNLVILNVRTTDSHYYTDTQHNLPASPPWPLAFHYEQTDNFLLSWYIFLSESVQLHRDTSIYIYLAGAAYSVTPSQKRV